MSDTIWKRTKRALIAMAEDITFTPKQRLDATRQLAQLERDRLNRPKPKIKPLSSQSTSVLGSK